MAILKGANDFTLVIMKGTQASYPDAFHIGFMLDSEEAVMEAYGALKRGSIAVGRLPGKIRDSFGFYFHLDNIIIEVGHYVE
ncbi:MAG TPA: hypothetical protein VFX43_17680 [Chitinophagaceae bacterium]|nr:hypothetical protein [Chitinophagaceae bacterium]